MDSRRFIWIFACLIAFVCVVLCAAAHLRLDNTVIDDAFITYRYSARLATGDGLTYNDGERVLGTTTPGYAMLMAGVGVVGGTNSIPLASRLLNLAFLLVAGGFAVLIARRFTQNPLLLVGVFALFTLSPKTLVASYSGMEGAFFMALLCLGFWLLLTERWLLAALVLGLLPVVRPEGVFVVGLTGLVLLIGWIRSSNEQRATSNESNARDITGKEGAARENKRLARPGLGKLVLCGALLGAPIVIWGVVATLYYGSPLPHSIVAKQAGLYPIGKIGSFISLLGGLTETYAMFLLLPNPLSRLPSLGTIPALLLLIVLSVMLVLGGRKLAKAQLLFVVLPLFTSVMQVFYATSETLIFPQYYAFFEPLAKLCWWAGIAFVVGLVLKKQVWAWGIAAVIVFLPLVALYPYNSVGNQTIDLHELEVATLRQPLYRAISQQLQPILPEGTVVLMPEIGELGFYLPNVQVLDSAGLVSPQAIAYLPIPEELQNGPGIFPPDLVQDQRPDLIITQDVFMPAGLLETDWFMESYTAVVTWTYDWLPVGSEAFYVFARNDFAAGMAIAELGLEMTEPAYVR